MPLINVVLFQGTNASDEVGLWETNGATTFELAPIAGANASGLSPSNITAFNGEALFEGLNNSSGASGHFGLWVTNGSGIGTHELIVAGASPAGLSPNNLTVFNGQVLFNGTDSGGATGLWTTNGTAGGTSELTNSSARNPGDLTVFSNEVLFNATVSGSTLHGLWKTDGTNTPTHTTELTGIAGAATTNLGLNPSDLTVFNNEALFSGVNDIGPNGQVGLWVTDGTALGTHELGGVTGANPTHGLNPTFLTAYNGEVLFQGLDDSTPSGQLGLWVTNGTSAPGATHQITGITGANSSGLMPRFLTAYNGEVLFNGFDSNGLRGFWETNGTVAGTHELFAGAGGPSDPSGLNPSGFALYNGVVVFNGEDSNGHPQLWEWNGTTVQEATGVAGASSTGLDPFDLTPATLSVAATNDILWQSTDGQAAIWEITGNTLIGGGAVTPNPGPAWQAIGTGDFFDNALSDILWQNTNGQAAIWEMNGTSLIGGGTVSPNPGPSWKAIGTGDFNDDGHSDILWQNANGQAAIWEMNGTSLIGGGAVTPNPGPSWKAIGTGDFNDDGHSDILWQNSNGQAAIWDMNGNNVIGGGTVTPNPGPSWKAIGTGDFNGDGHSDILWQNTNGQVAIWEMNGNNVIGGGTVSADPGPSWHAIGTGGEGSSDILFQNTNGQTAVWDMNGTTIAAGGVVNPNPGSSWKAIALT